jgi:integrase
MYSNVLNWLDFYETYLLRRPLQPDDHIFPAIGANGTSVHPTRPMTADVVQKRITEMATKAGIDGAEYFTTHCFRSGGAQYRFMFAPVGQRWTLARIRWWGGWAQGEHVS